MKKATFLFIGLLIFTISIFAQAPNAINFQAVARGADGEVLANTPIQIRLTVLNGSPTGDEIYQELRAVTTNNYGSFSFQIGRDADFTTIGTIDVIDWGGDAKFLKIDYDPTNQFNWELTLGTIEFVSVPYALHSKTAESLIGELPETDPFFAAWDKDFNDLINIPATIAGYGITDAFSGSYNDLSNKPVNATTSTSGFMSNTDKTKLDGLNGSETKISAGPGGKVTGTGTTADPYKVGTVTYAIGDWAHHGIVFWLDESKQHGLVCAVRDQSSGIRWNAGTDCYTRAYADGIYAGKSNTAIIIAVQSATADDGSTYAARLCNEYAFEGMGGWYLPCLAELMEMYNQRTAINATAVSHGGSALVNDSYWSSDEYINTDWAVRDYNPMTGTPMGGSQKLLLRRVRAIRAF